MKYRTTCVFLSLLLFPLWGVTQQVTNVSSQVKDNKIEVRYTLSGKFYNLFDVALYVSLDGGKTFQGPLEKVTGDVGEGIRRGTHAITWDVFNELPFVSETVSFEVKAEISGKKPKKAFFVSYVGNAMTYVGLRAGMLGMVGFYGEVRGNLNALKSGKYLYREGTVDYDQPGYFVFTGQNGYSAWSALAGINYQPARDFFLYLGAGYGKEDYLLGMDQFSYEGDVKTGSAYARYDGYCTSGVEIDLGMMYRIKWLLLSAGGTMLNFRSFNFTAGIGAAF